MSTPTAAGQTAPRMAITEPTVAPLPKCTSGITARPLIHGRVATFRSCCIATSSTEAGSAHIRIGTWAPGTSTYDITSSIPPKIHEKRKSRSKSSDLGRRTGVRGKRVR